MRRSLNAAGVVILILSVSGPSVADQGGGSFEGLMEQAEDAKEPVAAANLLATANDAMGACSCRDEFAKRECMQKTNDAVQHMVKLKGAIISAPIAADNLELGTYDFKKGRFPVTIKGAVAHQALESTVDGCELKTVSCDREEDEAFVAGNLTGMGGSSGGDVEPEAVLTTATNTALDNATIWTGTFSIPDAEKARSLKESKGSIKSQAIYRVEGFQLITVEDKKLAMKRAAILEELAKTVKKYDAIGGAARAHARSIAIPRMKCVERYKPGVQVGAVRVKLIGIRLWLDSDDFSEYLVSEPLSTVPLSKQKAAEAEAAQKEQYAKEHPSKRVDGWGNLKFGISARTALETYPDLALVSNPPFTDQKPNPNVKTYKAKGLTPDVQGVFLQFYEHKLFYIVVGFNFDALGLKTTDEAVRRFSAEFGAPRSVNQAPHGAATGVQVVWDSGPSGAQLILYPRHLSAGGTATLHVVDSTIQEQSKNGQ